MWRGGEEETRKTAKEVDGQRTRRPSREATMEERIENDGRERDSNTTESGKSLGRKVSASERRSAVLPSAFPNMSHLSIFLTAYPYFDDIFM